MLCFTNRVLEQVDFEAKFDQLPQFNPDDSETGTPITRSPRDIIKSFKKRQKHNLGTLCLLFIYICFILTSFVNIFVAQCPNYFISVFYCEHNLMLFSFRFHN